MCDIKDLPFYSIGFEHITTETINDFLVWLSEDRKCSDTTLNHHLAVIRAFLKYAGMNNPAYANYYVIAQNVPFKKVVKRLTVNHFDEATLTALLAQPDSQNPKGHRDLFFMILLYDTAARDSELLDLRPCDFVTDAKAPYVILQGKGRKIRTVPIMRRTLDHFYSYIKRMGLNQSDESTLFYTTIHGKRHRMSDDNVARFLNKYTEGAKRICASVPDKITPHMFRHSRALNLYQNGVPLALISEWLGHTDIETTLIYAYADMDKKRKAIQKATSTDHPICTSSNPSFSKNTEDEIKRYYGLK
jgi:site-specific recombinase XerD